MTPKIRSFSGAALMLVIIPIFAGLLACMPVPVGDPEKSRTDPEFNGAWLLESDSDLAIYQFIPWDKRTWLLMGTMFEEGDEFEGELPDIETPADLEAVLENTSIGDGGITASEMIIYKVWMARIGGERFMTWELLGPVSEKGREPPEYWFVYKVTKNEANRYELLLLNGDSDVFDDIPSPKEYDGDDYAADMRKKYERVIKRNLDNEDLYAEEPFILHPLSDEAQESVFELIGEIVEMDVE